MMRTNSLAVYKNRPALIIETGEKITISLLGGENIRVREKDIELIHPGPCTLSGLEEDVPGGDAYSAWELVEGNSVTLKELAELVYDVYTAKTAWAAYLLLKDGLYFTGEINAVKGRSPEEVRQGTRKRQDRQQDREERDAFLERLKTKTLRLPEDGRFLQDVEALAYGKTDKSRTLKDLGKPETPQEAHRLLLTSAYWTHHINPYPARFGISLSPARTEIRPPSEEERLDLTHLKAFAIDNAWSADPDDAISIEDACIWVHVADPAAVITPGSPGDIEARGRGATLYLPEGTICMLGKESLPFFALGLSELSPALSFKIVVNEDFSIKETEIFRSWVKVTRLTYEEADALITGGVPSSPDKAAGVPDLIRLREAAERNVERRLKTGAVSIELPETHISVCEGQVSVEPLYSYRSAAVVRECMLLAGESAALWALQRRLPFPYVSQEAGDTPNAPLDGLAGFFQLRRCMRPRTLSAKPGIHWGLGLDTYTQVTSPLRRYTDLLAHQQIRGFLRNDSPLNEDEILLRLAAGEAAALNIVQAERGSRYHWLMVYLSDKKGTQWKGVVMEKRGPRYVILIPVLGMETQVAVKKELEPNEEVMLTLSSVKIPEGEAAFIAS
ncbi:MAG: RNB domain-containing ribonuclease [Treponema sp.]|jgi:exoribonuclease-2|nr:RNB domain-containing ribonuclease [Treponema sp.]